MINCAALSQETCYCFQLRDMFDTNYANFINRFASLKGLTIFAVFFFNCAAGRCKKWFYLLQLCAHTVRFGGKLHWF